MDFLTFISEIIRSLAWPVTVLLVVFFLRESISTLIPFLRRMKYKEFEIEFAREVAALVATAPQSVIDTNERLQIPDDEHSRLLNLANFSPRAAIIEAWLEVESAANIVASSFWGQPPSDIHKNSRTLGEYLLQCKVIDKAQLLTFNKLRELRNKAAHADEFGLNQSDARSYVELALALTSHIKK